MTNYLQCQQLNKESTGMRSSDIIYVFAPFNGKCTMQLGTQYNIAATVILYVAMVVVVLVIVVLLLYTQLV